MKKFADLTTDELWQLRQEVVLNSLYVSDYENSFGYHKEDMCLFFESYLSYLCEMMEEMGIASEDHLKCLDEFDNPTNLKCWYDHYEDFSWVRMAEPYFMSKAVVDELFHPESDTTNRI